jgi:hypothetical protein
MRTAIVLVSIFASMLLGVESVGAQVPFQPPISCEDLFNSDDGILLGSNLLSAVPVCTFPGLCPGCLALISLDPNDKVGSFGAASFLASAEPLRYAVYFENLATASAAAQQVVITDRLDGGRMDLGSLSLGPIAFGDRTIVPPPGLSSFTTDVDLRPASALVARIAAALDPRSGVLTWRFVSIDPATGQPTTDPLAGFLPPNTTPPAGQGSVVFTVNPTAGLTTGTQICNQASIVFDVNAAIQTPQWCNTIDATGPTSRVSPLAGTQRSPSFPVQWSGSDAGSGIRDYTIFVSESGGPPTAFRTHTSDTSATFTGRPGFTYAFSSVARDKTGNVETAHASADTSTRVAGVLDHITISPGTVTITAGGSQTYTAQAFDIANFALGDVTDATTFTISPDGSCVGAVCTATVAGVHTITGTDAGKIATATLTVVANSQGTCPHGHEFWEGHRPWPVSTWTLGNRTYTPVEVLKLLETPVRSRSGLDASVLLARELIVAKLNIASGVDPAPIHHVLTSADALLSRFNRPLPLGVKPFSEVGERMTFIAALLERFNRGALTPHCHPERDDIRDHRVERLAR